VPTFSVRSFSSAFLLVNLDSHLFSKAHVNAVTTISSRISTPYAPTLIVALLQVIGSFTEVSPRTNARYLIATQLTNNFLGPLRPSSNPHCRLFSIVADVSDGTELIVS
jgi:hypothetical protein